MKRIISVLVAVCIAAVVGCAKQTPEDAAKAAVEKQIAAKHQGFIFDTSDLEYEVVKEGEDFARVMVSGEIEVTGEVYLVKKGGKWVLGAKPAPALQSEAPAVKSEPAGPPAVEKTDTAAAH